METKGCNLERLSYAIIGTALRVHSRIGPGCSESVYKRIMYRSLVKQELYVECEKQISFEFDGEWYEEVLKADLVVERSIIVELKSQKGLTAIDQQQVLTYMRLLDIKMGLLLNFGELHLRDGIKRILNNYTPSFPSQPTFPS